MEHELDLLNAQNSHAQYDLKLQHSDIILEYDTLSCHNDYFYQIILKSQDRLRVRHKYKLL